MASTAMPGILYVKMQTKPHLPAAEFQDWYNNEHGPLRLRLSEFVKNGFRYKATDLDGSDSKFEWMAIYDLTDMSELTKGEYMKLRSDPIQSQRERDLRPYIEIDRKSFDLVKSWEAKEFRALEDVDARARGNVMIASSLFLKPEASRDDFDEWFNEEYFSLLSKMKGWLRSRRFVTSTIDQPTELEYLALHEFAPDAGIDWEEFAAAANTTRAKDIKASLVEEPKIRTYELYYTFGPTPRDLSALSRTNVPAFDSPATRTRTMPSQDIPAIESYVTTKDSVVLPFRLEGSPDPDAPLIVLCNSILVEWGIWDGFVTNFLSDPQNKKYRILRYLSRGRSSDCGDLPITVDVLASDIVALLDALRVPQAALAVGVSLGGATVLCAGLKYPDRIARFISCDTSSKSPEGNSKLWKERITMAEQEGAVGSSQEAVVGEELAEVTARRWFVKESYDGRGKEAECERVKIMVVNNSLEGFKASVQALWEYDLRPQMKAFNGKGAFLVGSQDGVLPGTMMEMAAGLGEGSECVVIDGAGHLPMVEKPQEVVAAVTKFLSQ